MSIYERYGIRTLINAAGEKTLLGGSRMEPEVLQAMEEASQRFSTIEEIEAKASAVIAKITGAEAGYVASGAAAGPQTTCTIDGYRSDEPAAYYRAGEEPSPSDQCRRLVAAPIASAGHWSGPRLRSSASSGRGWRSRARREDPSLYGGRLRVPG